MFFRQVLYLLFNKIWTVNFSLLMIYWRCQEYRNWVMLLRNLGFALVFCLHTQKLEPHESTAQ